jgi:hypothetical protein
MNKALERRLRRIEARRVFDTALDKLLALPTNEFQRHLRAMSDAELDRNIEILEAELGGTDAT